MDEYVITVEIDGEKTDVKTFARSVEYAIDNMVKLDSIDKLFNILNTTTQQTWEFNEDIKELRSLRKLLPNNIEMFFGVQ